MKDRMLRHNYQITGQYNTGRVNNRRFHYIFGFLLPKPHKHGLQPPGSASPPTIFIFARWIDKEFIDIDIALTFIDDDIGAFSTY